MEKTPFKDCGAQFRKYYLINTLEMLVEAFFVVYYFVIRSEIFT